MRLRANAYKYKRKRKRVYIGECICLCKQCWEHWKLLTVENTNFYAHICIDNAEIINENICFAYVCTYVHTHVLLQAKKSHGMSH